MRITMISDTHGLQYRRRFDPEQYSGDILIHCGDVFGASPDDLGGTGYKAINKWIGEMNFLHKFLVPGNHDFLAMNNPEKFRQEMSNCQVLIDQEIELYGLKIYGTPWQPQFLNWAFNLDRDKLKEKYDLIPLDTDILITHCPPFGTLDRMKGSEELAEKVKSLWKLKLHCFGHIHEGHGFKWHPHYSVNCSVLDEFLTPTHDPITLEL